MVAYKKKQASHVEDVDQEYFGKDRIIFIQEKFNCNLAHT